MFINKNSDSLFHWFCKLLLQLWRTRIRSGLTVSSLDSRPGLFTIEICLGHCVLFQSRKLNLAPFSGQERTSLRNFIYYMYDILVASQTEKICLTMCGKYPFGGMDHFASASAKLTLIARAQAI